MKRYTLLYYIAALFSFTTVSCNDENSLGEDYVPSLTGHYLYLDNTSIDFDATAGSHSRSVKSLNTSWQFTGITDWLTLSQTYGNSNASILFKASENKSGDETRTALLVFESTDPSYNYSCNLPVSQSANTPDISVLQSSFTFEAKPFTQNVGITANVAWTVSSSESWLTVTASDDVSKLQISAGENQSANSRTATITIKGTTASVSTKITVTQLPANVSLSEVNPIDVENVGGNYQLSITSDVSWTASTDSPSWIELSPESGAAGTSTLAVSILPNTSVNARTGYIFISIGTEKVITLQINQRGLYIETEPTSLEFTAETQSKTLNVKSNTNWKVLSKPEWLTVSATEGSGNKQLSLSVSDNWDTSARSSKLKLGKEGTTLSTEITINQKGRDFPNLISALQFESTAATQTVDVTTNGRWTATSNNDWISVTPGSGTGDATLSVTVTENTTDDERIGTVSVTVGSIQQTIAVTQKGKYFTIDPTAFAELPSKGGSHSLHISTNESWTAKSSSTWIQLSQKSGSGDIDITLTAPDNPSIMTRNDTTVFMTEHVQPVRLITRQAGRYLTTDVTELHFSSIGGTSSVINIQTDATFVISSTVSWLIIQQQENTFTATVSENDGEEIRNGVIIISMTGIPEGESFQLEIPVIQRKHQSGVYVDGYTDELNWDGINSFGITINVTHFGDDKNWD